VEFNSLLYNLPTCKFFNLPATRKYFYFTLPALFLRKLIGMEQTKKYKGLWWLVFLASTAAFIFAIYSHWPWLTLILPFQTTAFVKAMDIM
jgi:predicted permease